MGCKQSAPETNTRSLTEAEEAMADKLPEPAPPAPTDPRLPLDPRQVFKLKKSWKGIKRCMESTGVEMFIRMFRSNTDIKRLFAKFGHLKTEEEMRMDDILEKHATTVMATVDEAMNNIDNVDFVLTLLKHRGNYHKKIPGFTSELFWAIEIPFLEAVKITLGDRYSENMDTIYKITIKFVLQTMVDGYDTSNAVS
ncbi:globin-5-like [Ylistrum balloti]|uniref:globin-5-like n=1 Tax=Ylistrum balloti TaxID=509963 RepID=UPI002905BBC3|nr:globin-5-like [Ylistrum balloti]